MQNAVDIILVGALPTSIYALSNLERLTINNNLFRGTLPPEFFQLTKLVNVFIGFNHFSGSLLPFSKLKLLTALSVAGCNFYGSIPSQFGSALKSLTLFYATKNQLTGTLPSQLSLWTNIKEFDVKRNKLVGTLPNYLGQWSSLQLLRASYNSFHVSLEYFCTVSSSIFN